MLQQAVDPDACAYENDNTPLLAASCEGNVAVARVLLEAGADKDAQDADGRCPLYEAAREGHLEVARVLLAAGADKNLEEVCGQTALYAASSNRSANQIQRYSNCAEGWKEHGASIQSGNFSCIRGRWVCGLAPPVP